MELWIRSQDRQKLVKPLELELDNDKTGLYCNYYSSCDVFVGKYKTKERALEVLDEIQNAILCSAATPEEVDGLKIKFRSWYGTNLKTGVAVYEMPKE